MPKLEKEFKKYFLEADKTMQELLASDSPFIDALKHHHNFFIKILSQADNLSPFSAFLSFHSLMLFNAALRTAFSGHEVATYPLLRAAQEAACYSFLISNNPDLEKIWLNRHENSQALKICRDKFSDAIKQTAKSISQSKYFGEDIGSLIEDCYQQSIDFGAHPNPKSILHHLTINDQKSPGPVEIKLVGLYSSNSLEIHRILVACLDFGNIIAIILTYTLNEFDKKNLSELQKLIDEKNNLVKTHFK